MKKKGLLFMVFVCIGVLTLAPAAFAIPALQLYIEGAEYNTFTETWVVSPTTDPLILWVLGDVGHYGTIRDVHLYAAVDTTEYMDGGTIALTETTVTGGFTAADGTVVVDPSTSPVPTPTGNFPSSDGQLPVMGDGATLPPHGEYGAGISFFEWALGDFTLTDSPIGDYTQGGCPDTITADCAASDGQINAYEVDFDGFTKIHFDASDEIFIDNHYQVRFAPFSHDAEIPEPSTAALLVVGGLFMVVGVIVRRKARSVR
jgi:hypothetical protein